MLVHPPTTTTATPIGVKRKSLIFVLGRKWLSFRHNSSLGKKLENVWHAIYAFFVMCPMLKKSYVIYTF